MTPPPFVVDTNVLVAELHGLSADDVNALLEDIVAKAIWREPAGDAVSDPGDDYSWALLFCDADTAMIADAPLWREQPRPGRVALTPTEVVCKLNLP